jgi:predicted nucleotidyltransferase
MSDRGALLDGLPDTVAAGLAEFLDAARHALGTDLVSAVLFGSAADGRLAPTSDVNLLLVLQAFSPDKLAALRDALLKAAAAINLRVMFLLEGEIPSAAEFFAQKFADIRRRHRLLVGQDVLASLAVPRSAEIFRLRQMLLNLVLRMREAFVSRGRRPEQVTRILTDALGPLRAACATLLELEGAAASDSDAALTSVAAAFGPDGSRAAARIVAAHAGDTAEPATEQALVDALTFASHMLDRAGRLT